MSLRVYSYAGCDTCRQALRWLQERAIKHEVVPIREKPPTVPELRSMLLHLGGETGRLFNTSGRDYRASGLKDCVPSMPTEEVLARLADNGNLVKRPFVLGENAGTVGFKPDEWDRLFARP